MVESTATPLEIAGVVWTSLCLLAYILTAIHVFHRTQLKMDVSSYITVALFFVCLISKLIVYIIDLFIAGDG